MLGKIKSLFFLNSDFIDPEQEDGPIEQVSNVAAGEGNEINIIEEHSKAPSRTKIPTSVLWTNSNGKESVTIIRQTTENICL